MKFIETSFRDLWLIETDKKRDTRGFFSRLFCKQEFQSINFNSEFVQENVTFTKNKGTFRGLHYQLNPFSEKKLIRCISGKVFDVVIDLRKESKTFLKCFSVVLDGENLDMILVPEGFAHGFQTLSDDCLMLYFHTNYYNSYSERGISVNDPMFKINLPLLITEISERDMNHPFLNINFEGLKYEV
jgi:dTDP-4-dehydrorhamnose 3,5-epimerase